MGIRVRAAAAVMAMGSGQAEAVTVDRVMMTLTGQYYCEAEPCETPAPDVSKFYGIPLDTSVIGFLTISDPDKYNGHSITFSFKNNISKLGYFEGDDWYYVHPTSFYGFIIEWDGKKGLLYFRDDNYPWSLGVDGTLALAPVPLPASAALLPLGIGALAMMRRRRRS